MGDVGDDDGDDGGGDIDGTDMFEYSSHNRIGASCPDVLGVILV